MKAKPILLMCLCATALQAQPAPVDPFKDAGKPSPPPLPPRDLIVRYEVFSVEPGKAAVMRREKPGDGEFYQMLVGLLSGGQAVQEDFAILRCRSGNRVKMESIREIILPTEYEPPLIPGAAGQTVPPRVFAALPTAFETRTLGLSIEAEVTMGENRKNVDLRLAPSHVGQDERWKWGKGLSELQMPTFESQRLNTAVSLNMGMPCLLGTVNPPAASRITQNRIWFAFATVRLNEK